MMEYPQNEPAPSPPPVPQAPPPLSQAPPPLSLAPAVFPHGMPPVPTADDRSMAMLCHLLAIFTGFLGPLIVWLIKKDSSPFVDHHGREAINFQITIFLAMFTLVGLTMVLMFVFIGFLLLPVIFVVGLLPIVAEVMACVAANNGVWHRYPFCLRLL